jgi:hypothetical protein
LAVTSLGRGAADPLNAAALRGAQAVVFRSGLPSITSAESFQAKRNLRTHSFVAAEITSLQFPGPCAQDPNTRQMINSNGKGK